VNIKYLIEEAVSLPGEDRALVVDSLLHSLNRPESKMDEKWANEAKRRLDEFRKGRVDAVSGEDVFGKVWARLEK